MNRAQAKEPSFTSIVQDCLERSDDFLRVADIMERTSLSINRVTASLAGLKKHKAVDFITEEHSHDDTHWVLTYWFATPDTDTRIWTVTEKVREEPGTRKRGVRK